LTSYYKKGGIMNNVESRIVELAKGINPGIIERVLTIHRAIGLLPDIIKKAEKKRKGTRRKFFFLQCSYTCNDCGESHPSAIEFHHYKPSNKRFSPGAKAAAEAPFELILDEVTQRTIALCRNCHALRHWRE